MPGDNADDGTESEYQIIKQATDQLQVPLYAILGDHDNKENLNLYNQYLESVNYQSFTVDQYHFVFLDVMSGISDVQKDWLINVLDLAG